ncbi:hypothetical protein TYRP_010080 [Tyrophagus putrescentiae]|nr:hypothetical protein TYRP_010080 [Tyrophagus putrescentiae]
MTGREDSAVGRAGDERARVDDELGLSEQSEYLLEGLRGGQPAPVQGALHALDEAFIKAPPGGGIRDVERPSQAVFAGRWSVSVDPGGSPAFRVRLHLFNRFAESRLGLFSPSETSALASRRSSRSRPKRSSERGTLASGDDEGIGSPERIDCSSGSSVAFWISRQRRMSVSSGEQQLGVFVYGVVDVDADAVGSLAGVPEDPQLERTGAGHQTAMANSWESEGLRHLRSGQPLVQRERGSSHRLDDPVHLVLELREAVRVQEDVVHVGVADDMDEVGCETAEEVDEDGVQDERRRHRAKEERRVEHRADRRGGLRFANREVLQVVAVLRKRRGQLPSVVLLDEGAQRSGVGLKEAFLAQGLPHVKGESFGG